MFIEIITPSDNVSKILSDLGKRRATVLDVISKGQHNKVNLAFFLFCHVITSINIVSKSLFKVINLLAPLAELRGYSSALRIITSGAANILMQPHGYAEMNGQEEEMAIRRSQGFE